MVTQASAAPGGALSIRIRGGASVTGNNEPLYVIDGFPIENDPDNQSPSDGGRDRRRRCRRIRWRRSTRTTSSRSRSSRTRRPRRSTVRAARTASSSSRPSTADDAPQVHARLVHRHAERRAPLRPAQRHAVRGIRERVVGRPTAPASSSPIRRRCRTPTGSR